VQAGNLTDVEFSLDGRRLATVSDNDKVQVWDVHTGALISALDHKDEVNSVRFSPDGRFLVTGASDLTARIWDVETGKLVRELYKEFAHGWRGAIDATFSVDGRHVIVRGGDVFVWNAETGKIVDELDDAWQITASPDGKWLAISTDAYFKIFDTRTWKQQSELPGHLPFMRSATFSSDGRWLITGNNKVWVWDPETGHKLAQLSKSNVRVNQEVSVNEIVLSADSKWLAVDYGSETYLYPWFAFAPIDDLYSFAGTMIELRTPK